MENVAWSFVLMAIVAACAQESKSPPAPPPPPTPAIASAAPAPAPVATTSASAPPAPAETARPPAPKKELAWTTTDAERGRAEARAKNRPLLLFFEASWSVATKEMQRDVFADVRVQTILAERYVTVRVDASDDTSAAVTSVLARYEVKGLPSVQIFDPRGQRLYHADEFIRADALLPVLERFAK